MNTSENPTRIRCYFCGDIFPLDWKNPALKEHKKLHSKNKFHEINYMPEITDYQDFQYQKVND